MTDQPRLSERLLASMAQSADDEGDKLSLVLSDIEHVIPELQALEAREERLRTALERMGFDIDALLAESRQEGAER